MTTSRTKSTAETANLANSASIEGDPLEVDLPVNLSQVLEDVGFRAGNLGITYLRERGSDRFQPYASLLEVAERIASGLRLLGITPGDKVILQLRDNQDFIEGFWGCTLCGSIPVPVSIAPTYQETNAALTKLVNVWEMLDRPVILTDSGLKSSLEGAAPLLGWQGQRIEPIDPLRETYVDGRHHQADTNDPALILFTSGSTGVPKGVVLKHRNVINQFGGVALMNRFTSEEITLNLFPLEHVASLVMCHLRDLYLRCHQIHAATNLFLERPLNWLDWIDRYHVTLTWAPNFAFALINEQSQALDAGQWDLTSLRFIINGGEAIVPETAERFMALLAQHGLPATSMHPGWGMSETSSAATFSDRLRVRRTGNSGRFVEVGRPIPGVSIRIVNAQDELLKEGDIGRLQIRGGTVMDGYYRNSALNREVFSAGSWFTTGDLGFIQDSTLTIAGREKDVIIIHGVCYYNLEIEEAVEKVSGIAPSYAAACAVRAPESQTDEIAIFFVPNSDDRATVSGLVSEIRDRIVHELGLNPSYIIPLSRESIPRTEIGKIQRSKLKARFESGEFEGFGGERLSREPAEAVGFPRTKPPRCAAYVGPRNRIERQICDIWEDVLKVKGIGISDNFFDLGGHSLTATQITAMAREQFGVNLPTEII